MATDQNVIDALVRAAEALLGRTLTPAERQKLLDAFNQASGSNRARAIEALKGLTNLTEGQIRTKTAASDDLNRQMDDLQNTLDDWNPKK